MNAGIVSAYKERVKAKTTIKLNRAVYIAALVRFHETGKPTIMPDPKTETKGK